MDFSKETTADLANVTSLRFLETRHHTASMGFFAHIQVIITIYANSYTYMCIFIFIYTWSTLLSWSFSALVQCDEEEGGARLWGRTPGIDFMFDLR